ncbi:hypothetical protein [Ilumatobacter nonamiensis]|uniref:hypothetical protein n=1 Tax=Ilumatobacter nonamiensis TaxID=467093 RepID=UPI0003465CB9|nr:hypothetical protein [Ilumatobacter nonamiensis]
MADDVVESGSGVRSGSGRVRTWYRALPPVIVLAATTIGALLGGVLLWVATERSFPAIGLAGVVLATAAAWVTTDYTASRWRDPGTVKWKTFVLVSAGAGAIAVIVADVLRSPLLAFLGLMALTFGIGPFVGEVRNAAAAKAERWMQAGLLVGAVSAIVIGLRILPVPLRLLAVVGLLVGFGLFTGGLSTMCARDARPQSFALRIIPGDARQRGLIVGAVGLIVLLVGLVLRWLPVVSVGAWLTIVAMVILSVIPARFGMSTLMKRSILVSGIVLVGVAGYQLFTTGTFGRSVWFTLFVVLTVALAGAWIVWRGSTLFIGVILGFAFVWGLSSHTTDDPEHVSGVDAEGDVAAAGVVAFGDSFISGEGAPTFYDGTDQKGDHRNECRRAPTAYPVLISRASDGSSTGADGAEPIETLSEPGLDFLACSGAKLAHVLELQTDDLSADAENRTAVDEAMDLAAELGDESMVESMESLVVAGGEMVESDDDADECPDGEARSAGQYGCGPDGVYGSELQLDHAADDRSATELVLLSIGGNDVRFGDIVAGCLLPGSCAERREIWLDNVAALGPELTEAYVAIREEFAQDVPIVVMPYPLVLTEDSCADSPLDASEHEFIFEFTTVLNRQISVSAAQAGVHYFAPGAFALEGNRLCESSERAINLIRLQPTDGPMFDRMNPGSWTHNSMHPNRLGHRMIAAELREWIDGEGILGSGNPMPDPSANATLLDVRSARPYAVDPDVVDVLSNTGVGVCGYDQIESFATRIAVFDEQSGDGVKSQAFRVPVEGAEATAPVCVTNSAGQWTSPESVIEPLADDSTSRLPSAEPAVVVSGGRVFVTGGRPDQRCLEQHGSHVRDDLCAFQWIMFSSPADDRNSAMSERTWSLRAVQYCTTDPDCEDTFDEWIDSQVGQAARKVGATLGMIFLGGWLVALGIELVRPRSLSARFRPQLRGAVAGSVGDSGGVGTHGPGDGVAPSGSGTSR